MKGKRLRAVSVCPAGLAYFAGNRYGAADHRLPFRLSRGNTFEGSGVSCEKIAQGGRYLPADRVDDGIEC